ncbi:oligosaccharide flippase family protein [bacterium]|nr:oligosaccharide flippase family protein [bacterium]
MLSHHGLFREGGWIVCGQIATVLGSLVLVRILTEYLPPAVYGELALAMTGATLVNQVFLGGLANGIARYFSIARERGEVHSYFRAVRTLTEYAVLAVGAVALVVLLVSRSAELNLSFSLLGTVALFAVLSGVNSLLGGIQNAARQRAVVALHTGGDAWLKIALCALLLTFLPALPAVVLGGYVLSSLFVTTSQYYFLSRLRAREASRSSSADGGGEVSHWKREILRYSWPFSVWGIFTWAQFASDRWALATFATEDEVGYFAVLYQIGYYPISLLLTMCSSFLAPILYERSGDASEKERVRHSDSLAHQVILLTVGITLAGVLLTGFFHRELFSFVVAEEFLVVSSYLPWFVLGGGVVAIGQFRALQLLSRLQSRKMMSAKVVTACIGVTLNFVGAAYFGIGGVLVALVLTALIFASWMHLLFHVE